MPILFKYLGANRNASIGKTLLDTSHLDPGRLCKAHYEGISLSGSHQLPELLIHLQVAVGAQIKACNAFNGCV